MPRPAVMITGAAGVIGARLVDALIATGHSVAVDRDRQRLDCLRRDDLLHLVTADVTNHREITDAVMETRPSALVHLAAMLHILAQCFWGL
jgi:nucleoside-diphosphate-sugar epimerase